MQNFSDLLAEGSRNAWIFAPSAIVLGALHGLEPGHSKTMMAAFIVAVRGTVMQAVLLGVSAAMSHSAIVWLVVIAGIHFQENGHGAVPEPYFQMASAAIMTCVALWMLLKTYRARRHELAHTTFAAHHHVHGEPHTAKGDHAHTHEASALTPLEYEDDHAKAHARQIERRFSGKEITTGQIILFGLTGGLIPCPAAITVLLLCLQMKQSILGFTLVLCFSIGLALTMVTAGVVASLGARQVAARWSGFSELARRAPYFSGAVIISFALYLFYQGWIGVSQL